MPTTFVFGAQVGTTGTNTVNQATDDVTLTATVDDGTVDVGDEVTFSGIETGVAGNTVGGGIADGETAYYQGVGVFEGQTGYVFTESPTLSLPTNMLVLFDNDSDIAADAQIQVALYASDNVPQTLGTTPACFAEGTRIATDTGTCAVEDLQTGDLVRTADGRLEPVRWIGRQTVLRIFGGHRAGLVTIAAGTLGNDADLTVTGDHALLIDGLLVNASALVNGTTIRQVPLADLPERFMVYHVETEAHEVILANGAPAESFIDFRSRRDFDNHAEYAALYGAERIVGERPEPRISSARMLPPALRARLGLDVAEPLRKTA